MAHARVLFLAFNHRLVAMKTKNHEAASLPQRQLAAKQTKKWAAKNFLVRSEGGVRLIDGETSTYMYKLHCELFLKKVCNRECCIEENFVLN